jgi:hypothetical protein
MQIAEMVTARNVAVERLAALLCIRQVTVSFLGPGTAIMQNVSREICGSGGRNEVHCGLPGSGAVQSCRCSQRFRGSIKFDPKMEVIPSSETLTSFAWSVSATRRKF